MPEINSLQPGAQPETPHPRSSDASQPGHDGEGPGHARRSPILYALIGLCVAFALFAAAGVGALLASSGRPASDSADAGFARDMQAHHAQAVDMSMTVMSKTKDPTLRAIAYDIATTQQQQSGQLYGWLELWDLPQADGEPMAWMHGNRLMPSGTHDMGGAGQMTSGDMPGMASHSELRRLRTADGDQAESLFLQLMIRHHEGGIEMARAVRSVGKQPQVLDLAQKMIDSQASEIAQMRAQLPRHRP